MGSQTVFDIIVVVLLGCNTYWLSRIARDAAQSTRTLNALWDQYYDRFGRNLLMDKYDIGRRE